MAFLGKTLQFPLDLPVLCMLGVLAGVRQGQDTLAARLQACNLEQREAAHLAGLCSLHALCVA